MPALSESFLVGLMTVGAKVGVFHLSSSVPVVRNIPLTHAGDLSLGLDEAFEFSQIFVPVRHTHAHTYTRTCTRTHAHLRASGHSPQAELLNQALSIHS